MTALEISSPNTAGQHSAILTPPVPLDMRLEADGFGRITLPVLQGTTPPCFTDTSHEDAWLLADRMKLNRTVPLLVNGPFSLPLGEVTTLFADGAFGKSLLAQDLAICVAFGLPFLGSKVKQGKVIYYDFEQHPEKAQRRFFRLCRGRSISPHTLYGRLIYRNFSSRGQFLHNLETEIEELIRNENPILIIVDGRQAAFGGDPVDTEATTQANQFLRWMTNGGKATVLELDHPSTSSKNRKEVSGNRFKRHFSRGQWCGEADKKNKDLLTLYLLKDNDGLPSEPVKVERLDVEGGVGIKHELKSSGTNPVSFNLANVPSLDSREQAYMTVLRRASDNELNSGDLCVRVAEFLQVSEGTVKNRLNKDIKPLIDRKLIEKRKEGRKTIYKAIA